MNNKALTDPKFIKCLRKAQDSLMSEGILPIGPSAKQYDAENDRHVTFEDLANEIAENLYKNLPADKAKRGS